MRVLVVHARGDLAAAESLAEPLRAAGFDVAHEGNVLVGESLAGAVALALARGDAVVVCGTVRAAGSVWVEQVAHAARAAGEPHRLFVVRMEPDANLRAFVFDARVADYARDPQGAIHELCEALTTYRDAIQGPGASRRPIFAVPALTGGEVDRPDLLEPLVRRLCEPQHEGRGSSPVGVTSIQGAGGFGKTTLAAMACHDSRVRVRYPDAIIWVTVGQNVRGPALANRINEVAELLSRRRPTFTEAEAAGQHLSSLLSDLDGLLVLDDLWYPDQLAPFLGAADACTRLVTTRVRTLLPSPSDPVLVDAMSPEQARRLLLDGTTDDPDGVHLSKLLALTGGWPVLVSLVNRAVLRHLRYGADLVEAVQMVEVELSAVGPSVLDVTSSARREDAVAATIRASERLLATASQDWPQRYHELAVFPDDTVVPLTTVEALWRTTGGLSARDAKRLCLELADLSMVQLDLAAEPAGLRLHDVVLHHLRQISSDRLPALHDAVLRGAREGIPPGSGPVPPWWMIPESLGYLRRHLSFHLAEAGHRNELRELLRDLRWAAVRLATDGATGIEIDLGQIATDDFTASLGRLVQQTSHLFRVGDPADMVRETLIAYAHDIPVLGVSVRELSTRTGSRLMPAARLPDQPNPALLRSIGVHRANIFAAAVSQAPTRLITGDNTGLVRVWDPASGTLTALLGGHTDRVTAIAVEPGGGLIVSASRDRTARVWNAATGACVTILSGHGGIVDAVVLAPNGDWVATGCDDGWVRIWNPRSGAVLRTLPARNQGRTLLALAAGGRLLVTAATNRRTVRVWDVLTGRQTGRLVPHEGDIADLVVSPDGGTLATAGGDGDVVVGRVDGTGTPVRLSGHEGGAVAVVFVGEDELVSAASDGVVRHWDLRRGRVLAAASERAVGVFRLALSADGTWLAATGTDGALRLWDLPQLVPRGSLIAHSSGVDHLTLAPDDAWVATSSTSEPVLRIWLPHRSRTAGAPADAAVLGIEALAISASGARFAVGDMGGRVLVWTGSETTPMTVDGLSTYPVRAIGMAPDGSWLVVVDVRGEVSLWDAEDGSALGVLRPADSTQQRAGTSIAVSPDGARLAVGDPNGYVRAFDVAPRTLSWSLLTTGTGDSRTTRNQSRRVRGLVASPAGAWVAVAESTGFIQTLDWATGVKVARLGKSADEVAGPDSHGASIRADTLGIRIRGRAMAVSPHGDWLAAADVRGAVTTWDVETGRPVVVMETGGREPASLAAMPDGSRLVVGDRDGGVRLFHAWTGQPLGAVRPHEGLVRAVAPSADGQLLASVGDGGTVHVWDLVGGKTVAMLRTDSRLRFCAWIGGPKRLVVAGNRGVSHLNVADAHSVGAIGAAR